MRRQRQYTAVGFTRSFGTAIIRWSLSFLLLVHLGALLVLRGPYSEAVGKCHCVCFCFVVKIETALLRFGVSQDHPEAAEHPHSDQT
jgi:hypothetical protein